MSSNIVEFIVEQFDIGNMEAVEALFEKGAVLEHDHSDLIHLAVERKSLKLLKHIVDDLKDKLDIIIRLDLVITSQELDMVQYVVEEIGINPYTAIYHRQLVIPLVDDSNPTPVDTYLAETASLFCALETFSVPFEDRKQYYQSEVCMSAAKNRLIESKKMLADYLEKGNRLQIPRTRHQIRV
jgi:hypothetical protein